mmetsp:Transcript_35724/g.66710  ORF Transcript_35724/g.66710 Transcript_35724/m.66710 type:complete len:705 (+) Transcript_35724:248-2362(+)
MGGRATGRVTLQTRDVVVEGLTLAYLGMNLLDRTTLRLLQGHVYGLIGRNGVGKSTLLRKIYSGTLPGFPPHLKVAQVMQEIPVMEDEVITDEGDTDGSRGRYMTPVDYVVRHDPTRRALLGKIRELEEADDSEASPEEVEASLEKICVLYDMLENEGMATGRATNILKELGFSQKRREGSLSELSGGWKMRISIACALFQQPHVLLLDEPTNHLDLEGVEWLKQYLTSSAISSEMTVLVTSHDKDFLDNICTDIIRFAHQKLHYYPGNYTDYEKARNDKNLSNTRSQELINKERKHIEETIRKLQVTASRDTSGKGSGMVASRKKKLARHGAEKDENGHKFKVQNYTACKMKSTIRAGSQNETAMGYKTGESRSLMEQKERETKMVLPNPTALGTLGPILQLRNATIGFRMSHPTNETTTTVDSTPIGVEDTSISLPPPPSSTNASTTAIPPAAPIKISSTAKVSSLSGKKKVTVTKKETIHSEEPLSVVLENVTFDLEQKTKIALVGKNGTGKSTLMKLIASYGEEKGEDGVPALESGDMYKHHNIRIAYYQQHQADCLPYDLSPLAHFMNIAPEGHNEQTLRAHLGSFGLCGDLALEKIGILSGGQKARVVLAELTLFKPHLLLLDEPTNNIDLEGIKAMKEAVNNYDGACIIASHDMSFLDQTVDVVYLVAKKKVVRLENGIDEYKQFVKSNVSKQRKSK